MTPGRRASRGSLSFSPMHALLATRRRWLPVLAAAVCLLAAGWVGPIGTWLLTIAAFGFVLDAVTISWPAGDNLTKHKQ